LLYFPDGLANLVQRGQRVVAGPPSVRRPTELDPAAADGGSRHHRVDAAPAFAVAGSSGAGTAAEPARLEIDGATVRFGGLPALQDVSLTVEPGSVVGLIGPNGAGKTTLINVVSGFQPATGSVRFDGVDVSSWSADRRSRHGIGRTFQDARLFATMTVREVVQVAAATTEPNNVLLDAVVPSPWRRTERRIAERADAAIEVTGLGEYASSPIGVLSTGTRRMVEIAGLVARSGRLLLFDEPTAGLAQREVEAFPALLGSLREYLGATVVVVEHDVAMLSDACDRLVCLEAGEIIADGHPDVVRRDARVVESYLGPDLVAVQRSGSR
jgi:ABC-type branched-subunit amino acid transport system ATPase component